MPQTGSEDEIAFSVRHHLLDAVKVRLPHDGDVAVLLSGGLDSSIIAGMISTLLKSEPGRKLVCFTIGFDPNDFPDAAYYDETGK